jgi:hypothetical protein
MIRNERLAAAFDGTFVVFMIGMRIKPLLNSEWVSWRHFEHREEGRT